MVDKTAVRKCFIYCVESDFLLIHCLVQHLPVGAFSFCNAVAKCVADIHNTISFCKSSFSTKQRHQTLLHSQPTLTPSSGLNLTQHRQFVQNSCHSTFYSFACRNLVYVGRSNEPHSFSRPTSSFPATSFLC